MKIEVLYPEVCNLYGDIHNMHYLKKCLPDADWIETDFCADPFFADQDVQMVYMGPMTENKQIKAIEKLLPFRDRLCQLIEQGTVFFMTGNAYEIFGQTIDNKTTGTKTQGLGIFPIDVTIDYFSRYNGMLLGVYEDIEVVGFQSQFSRVSAAPDAVTPFIEVRRGLGLNQESKIEGVRKNNFFGTSLLGPFLILNPLFTKKLLQLLGVADPKLPLGEELMRAYAARLAEFQNPNIKF